MKTCVLLSMSVPIKLGSPLSRLRHFLGVGFKLIPRWFFFKNEIERWQNETNTFRLFANERRTEQQLKKKRVGHFFFLCSTDFKSESILAAGGWRRGGWGKVGGGERGHFPCPTPTFDVEMKEALLQLCRVTCASPATHAADAADGGGGGGTKGMGRGFLSPRDRTGSKSSTSRCLIRMAFVSEVGRGGVKKVKRWRDISFSFFLSPIKKPRTDALIFFLFDFPFQLSSIWFYFSLKKKIAPPFFFNRFPQIFTRFHRKVHFEFFFQFKTSSRLNCGLISDGISYVINS